MAEDIGTNDAQAMLQGLAASQPNCAAIGEAHTAVGEKWYRPIGRWVPFMATDFQRARQQQLENCRRTLSRLHELRQRGPHPALIHASDQVRQIQRKCRACPKQNKKSIEAGTGFGCLLTGPIPTRASTFRFNLNEKGDIVDVA
jgi:hypothetical protein